MNRPSEQLGDHQESPFPTSWIRFFREETAQDLVEYALLTAFIGTAAVAAAPIIRTAMGVAYSAWNLATQDQWVPPNPGA